jgi:hypothetical protein
MEIDLAAMSPTEGLARLVEITFDHHRLNEDFVRLVMVENIHHAKHIAHVAGIEARAQSIISLISGLLARGQAAGEFRKDIDALQVHMNVSGLAFFNVSNRHTIAQIFKHDLIDPAIIAQRRAVVVDTILRWVCVTPPVSV